ncbi:MAG: Rrf2 family transcriptional regulator [Fimbriimonadaceae bacterium]|nr:Rrf2 family transcriptional regulator [Fimbriimonadaceae bacterium]
MNLQLSRTSEYAVRLMVRLAMESNRKPLAVAELARTQDIPEAYLQKLLPALAKAELVRARRGPGGGFAVARPPAEISLRQVIEAVDGPIGVNSCMLGGGCHRAVRCPVHRVWRIAQRLLLALLEETDLAMLAAEGQALAAADDALAVSVGLTELLAERPESYTPPTGCPWAEPQ